jgi:hypothetical protein
MIGVIQKRGVQGGGVLAARTRVLFQFFVPNQLVQPRDEHGELG